MPKVKEKKPLTKPLTAKQKVELKKKIAKLLKGPLPQPKPVLSNLLSFLLHGYTTVYKEQPESIALMIRKVLAAETNNLNISSFEGIPLVSSSDIPFIQKVYEEFFYLLKDTLKEKNPDIMSKWAPCKAYLSYLLEAYPQLENQYISIVLTNPTLPSGKLLQIRFDKDSISSPIILNQKQVSLYLEIVRIEKTNPLFGYIAAVDLETSSISYAKNPDDAIQLGIEASKKPKTKASFYIATVGGEKAM